MTCSYCGARNDESDHRCQRCGRKPGDTLNGEFTFHRTMGALATKPRPLMVVEAPPPTEPPARTPDLAGAVQANLFTPNVIAMPSRGPQRPPRPRAGTPTSLAANKPPVKRTPRPVAEGQGQFEFFAPLQARAKTLATTVDGVIYCEAPVATPLHRALSAAIDLSMIVMGYGLFLLTFVLCRGEIVLNRPNLIVFLGMFGVVAATYGMFWTIARTETPGMRATHLRLITFDGFTPEPRQRAARLLGTCLSIFSVLGILWSLADEEGLGWQDHISRTFPTPHELESRVFRRR